MADSELRFRVLAFASAADALGSGELAVELAAGSTVADLKEHLEARFPELARHWPRLAVAVDGELAPEDTELSDGVEVALLPPVSGGAGAAGSGSAVAVEKLPRAALLEKPLDVEAVTEAVREPGCGAVLVFLGTVRDSHHGRSVTRLTYTAYRPMAETRLRRIVEELERGSASGRLHAAIHHRLGEVPAGEPSVVIAISSPHRDEAYAASREALERLKTEVPIWKREHYADGATEWREEEPLTRPTPPRAPSR
jgi:molybdopterin synthase catalytic subunit/molybdopterin converting factor small subunit